METQFLNQIEVQEHHHPWRYFQVDDFLPSSQFKDIQRRLCKVKDGYQKREDDIFDLNFMFLPDMSLAKMFLSEDFQKFLEVSTQSRLSIYEKSLVQLRLMTPNSPAFEPHVDDQDEKSLVCIWYLSPNWSPGHGGELNILKNAHTPLDSGDARVIAPLANRMVFFFSEDTHWHSVNKVNNWNRYSVISEWIVKN